METLLAQIAAMSIGEIAKYVIAILAIFGVAIDLTPWIKINPIRGVFTLIKNSITKWITDIIIDSTNDIRVKLDTQDTKINKLQDKVDYIESENLMDKIDRVRWEIIDFSNAIDNRDYDIEAYNHIVTQHDWYDKTIKERNIPNGRMDMSYAKIQEYMKRKIMTNEEE